MNGSPGQKCPKWIAQYCRGRNLSYTTPCWCNHPTCPTDRARFQLTPLDLGSAKGEELISKFMASGCFHDGMPRVVAIQTISNDVLQSLHMDYRKYLLEKNKEEPDALELFHGTNNNILDIVYMHGLQPPSDRKAAESCPYSGGKGLCTTLCDNGCPYCTEPHEWNRCHMFGLGIYLADTAAKSHRYVSHPRAGTGGRKQYRMVVCSVLGRSYRIAGHLTSGDAMHNLTNLRFLAGLKFEEAIKPVCGYCEESIETFDTLFIQGLGHACRPGYSVVNSEHIAFHPYQCLPKYEITYEI